MSHSFRELDYRGEFTYEYGSHMDSLRIVHAVRDGVEKERLLYLNGESREVVRDGHHLSCIHPGDQIMRLGSAIATGPFARSFQGEHDISRYYALEFGERTRVAGRSALQIVVRPGDQYRYGFHLYLDQQTGLLLKSLTISPAGKILERFQFTRIEIGAKIDDSELSGVNVGSNQAFHYVLEQAGAAGVQAASAGWLPPGFALSASNVHQENSQSVQLSMYTDGFSTLTLVLEPAQANVVPADGKARRGATVAYMRQLSVDGQPYLLTVVGEVPLITAKKVAQNVAIKRG
jgi:sigma-E factor negative regulatory protein RseB